MAASIPRTWHLSTNDRLNKWEKKLKLPWPSNPRLRHTAESDSDSSFEGLTQNPVLIVFFCFLCARPQTALHKHCWPIACPQEKVGLKRTGTVHAHTHRPYTPVKLSAATGTFHLGRLYLAALLPRSVRPYLSHSSSLSSPRLSCPSRLSSRSLVGSFLFSLPDDLRPFVIKSFGRHKICAIYHISLARKKCINSSTAFVKGGGEALSHRIIAQGFVPLVFLLSYEPSKLWLWKLWRKMRKSVRSEWTNVTCGALIPVTDGALCSNAFLANVRAISIAILSSCACKGEGSVRAGGVWMRSWDIFYSWRWPRLGCWNVIYPTTDLRLSPRLQRSTATFVEQGRKLHQQNYCVWLKKHPCQGLRLPRWSSFI